MVLAPRNTSASTQQKKKKKNCLAVEWVSLTYFFVFSHMNEHTARTVWIHPFVQVHRNHWYTSQCVGVAAGSDDLYQKLQGTKASFSHLLLCLLTRTILLPAPLGYTLSFFVASILPFCTRIHRRCRWHTAKIVPPGTGMFLLLYFFLVK
jgi:hypothetical protein